MEIMIGKSTTEFLRTLLLITVVGLTLVGLLFEVDGCMDYGTNIIESQLAIQRRQHLDHKGTYKWFTKLLKRNVN